ncbi:UNVERIFIED_CONTAM: hypothetical protein PYX00_011199 [Menopon gallinae]|uniref:Large ribosomal subunit protein uL10m n=1 Tax=Menopon gallinae TaxID=328185 RepID=A0AAW2H6N0_9NEOP
MGRAWYILQTASQYEKKVEQEIRNKIEDGYFSGFVTDVLVPVEKAEEIKQGKKRIVERKVWPGYVMVEMDLPESAWREVLTELRKISGVSSVVGYDANRRERPLPMSQEEVRRITVNAGEVKTSIALLQEFEIGQEVKIKSGPFKDFQGKLEEVDYSRKRVKEVTFVAKKKVSTYVKLQVPAGKATPAPPVGPALGPHGVSAPQFVQQFNDRTKSFESGLIIPVVITVYSDKSFDFVLKTPPASVLIKKELGLSSGSKESHKVKVGALTKEQLRKIAEIKMPDLNANDIEAAMRIVAGTARSMGVDLAEAVALAKETSYVKFDASLDFSVKLNLKKSHTVRDTVVLPNQFKEEKRILVFAKGEKAEEARIAGASYVGDEDLVEKIKGGWLDFDVAVSTPDMMREVGKIGMVLGRRGLMPNPKTQTVTTDVAGAIAQLKKGRTEFRADKTGVINIAVGKVSMDSELVIENIKVFMNELLKRKPSDLKGDFVKSLAISSTMGPDYRGLSVSQLTSLRRKLRENSADLKVVKNNLAKIAFKNLNYNGLDAYLKGPTTVISAQPDSSSQVARILHDYTSESTLLIKGGMVEGEVYSAEQVIEFSKLPNRLEAIAQFMGVLNGAMSKLARTLKALAEAKSE